MQHVYIFGLESEPRVNLGKWNSKRASKQDGRGQTRFNKIRNSNLYA